MNYELFVKLYGEALEYSELDLYIAERGWQSWMDTIADHVAILKVIYQLANQSFREMRESSGYSRVEFSRAYKIPIRSLENWESGAREAPVYVITLIAYTLLGAD